MINSLSLSLSLSDVHAGHLFHPKSPTFCCRRAITFWNLGHLQFLALFLFIVKCPLFISFLGNQNIVNNRGSFFPPPLLIVKDTAETWFSPGSSYSAQSHLQFPLSFSSSCCTLALHTYVPNLGSTFSGSPSYRHKTRVGGQRGQREIFSIFYFLPKPTVRLAQTLHPTYLTWYTL